MISLSKNWDVIADNDFLSLQGSLVNTVILELICWGL